MNLALSALQAPTSEDEGDLFEWRGDGGVRLCGERWGRGGDGPVLFLHGTADAVVPHTMSDELYVAARSVPPGLKRLVKIEGAAHSNAIRSGSIYDDAVHGFIRDAGRAYRPAALRAGSGATDS